MSDDRHDDRQADDETKPGAAYVAWRRQSLGLRHGETDTRDPDVTPTGDRWLRDQINARLTRDAGLLPTPTKETE